MKHDSSRFGFVAAFIAFSFIFMCGTSRGQATQPADHSPRFKAAEFSSPLALEVWAQRDDGEAVLAGETPSDAPIKIPACRDWWVKPKAGTSVEMLADAVRAGTITRIKLSEATDGDVAKLNGLTSLQSLDLSGTKVTGAVVAQIATLTGLDELNLEGTAVGSAALVPIKALKNLQRLNLAHSQILGLYNLEILAGLQELNLAGTPVADPSLQHFKHMAGMRILDLSNTKVTDAGMDRIKILKNLKKLNLSGTAVTEAGVAGLKSALPDCEVTTAKDLPTTRK